MLPGFDVDASPDAGPEPLSNPLPWGNGVWSLESIDDAIERLAEAMAVLAEYLAAHVDEMTVGDMTRLMAVYGQNLSRYARLVRDKARLEGDAETDLAAAADEALRLAGTHLEVELLPRDQKTG
jgi:hypothetical protein